MGMIFDIKRYAIHDGPGIRTTVFLKGCPLNCLWCHNPEGISQEQELMWWAERCIGCRSCEDECPRGAVSFARDSIHVDHSKCDLCGRCVRACPPQALALAGEEITVSRLVEEIEKDAVFYDESGGGVTLSGGEPLLQPEFSRAILECCNELNIHTALDTCGYADFTLVSDMCERADLVLYDLKVIDAQKHVNFTGVSNDRILRNLTRLARNGTKIILRYPLIPGMNDSEEDIRDLGKYVSSLECVPELHILQYHRAGANKVKRCVNEKRPFIVAGSIPTATLEEYKEEFISYGLKVRMGA